MEYSRSGIKKTFKYPKFIRNSFINENIKKIEDVMQDIYYESEERPKIINYPPFMFTPEYYDENKYK